MIIKSHIRGGYRAAADYLKDVGKNEKIRLVQISDPDASNLDEAFRNMWAVACNSKVKKPLHHISINPFRDERLTDEQVLKIVKRCEEKYGYKSEDHQRVIVEHILNGRQHFHVMWNRVSLTTGRAKWPGHHWKKSKQAAREMEAELGLKRPMPKRVLRHVARHGMANRYGHYRKSSNWKKAGYGQSKGGRNRNKNGTSHKNDQPKPWRISKAALNDAKHLRYWQPAKPAHLFPIAFNRQTAISKQTGSRYGNIGSAGRFWSSKSALFYRTGWKADLGQRLSPFTFGNSISPRLLHLIVRPARATRDETPELSVPHRHASYTGMSEAQRIDFLAACEGKITWRQYFQKWGRGGLSL